MCSPPNNIRDYDVSNTKWKAASSFFSINPGKDLHI